MKKIFYTIIIGTSLMAATTLSACTLRGNGQTGLNLPYTLELATEKPEDAALTGKIDLTQDAWLDAAYTNFADGKTWIVDKLGRETVNYSGETLSEDTIVLSCISDYSAIAPGWDGTSLKIGTSKWSDYTLSFDFLLIDDGEISFAVYSDSCVVDYDGDPKTTEEGFCFKIDEKGIRMNATYSGGDYITGDDGNLIMGQYDTNVWNNIKLSPDGNDLHIIFNGVDKGVLYTFSTAPYGSVGFDAGSGCLIKDMEIK